MAKDSKFEDMLYSKINSISKDKKWHSSKQIKSSTLTEIEFSLSNEIKLFFEQYPKALVNTIKFQIRDTLETNLCKLKKITVNN